MAVLTKKKSRRPWDRRRRPAGRPQPRSNARNAGAKNANARAGGAKSPGAKPTEQKAEETPSRNILAALAASGKSARLLMTLLGVLVLLYLAALVFLRPASPGQEVRLDTVTRYAVCAAPKPGQPDPALDAYCRGVTKRIAEARFLDEDARIVGKLTSRTPGSPTESFWTSYPKSDAATNGLLQNLYSSGAEVSVDSQSLKGVVRFVAQFLLPLVILADLFALLFMLIQSGGGSSQFTSFGRAGARRKGDTKGGKTETFADVAGAREAVTELAEVRDYLANPSAFAAMGALPPKGVLLMGPPGCGKTLLARAVAGEVKATYLSMSGSEFVEALVGIGAARVRDLFAQARASAPAVIFIDEIDAVGRQRGAGVGQGHDEREQTLNELLTQIDGFSPAQGIVVIGATNRPDILDPALLRAGRFDRHITVERPDLEGRLEILRLHARNRPVDDPETTLAEMAQNTPGFTGADLANAMNEAALLAVRERAGTIGRTHLEEAVERVLAGPKRRGQIMSDDEKRTIAYHEAGHAVVAAALGKRAQIRKVSIISRGRGVGHLAMLGTNGSVVRRGNMEADVAIAMAGFAAEELTFGEPSSGSEGDIERATTTARDMAGRYGMSVRLGPVRVLAPHKEVFLGRDYLSTSDVSQPTLEHLDAEVRRILEEQKGEAAAILEAHRSVLDAVASQLFENETLQGPDLERLLDLPITPRRKPRATSVRAARAKTTPA
jgi:cell division protease FtsH